MATAYDHADAERALQDLIDTVRTVTRRHTPRTFPPRRSRGTTRRRLTALRDRRAARRAYRRSQAQLNHLIATITTLYPHLRHPRPHR